VRLGLLVTTDRLPAQAVGLVRAAVARGDAVTVFATDTGTRLLRDPAFAGLAGLPGVGIAYCALSAGRHGGRPAGLPEAIREGSQFDGSLLVDETDRLIVL
jgi:hypothetical protein